MASASKESTVPEFPSADSEQRLLDRARRGSQSALGALSARNASWLRRWAQGRLPAWAREGLDTSDLVQDALHGTLARISTLRSAHAAALRCYLRRAVENRIGDYRRRALFRLKHGGPSGEVLWEINLGSPLTGFPVTYAVDGKQYVAVSTGTSLTSGAFNRLTPELRPASGNTLFVFALP